MQIDLELVDSSKQRAESRVDKEEESRLSAPSSSLSWPTEGFANSEFKNLAVSRVAVS